MNIDVSRRQLEHAAEEINRLFKYKPDEQIDTTVEDFALIFDIRDAAEEFRSEDSISKDTEETLKKIEAKIPSTAGTIDVREFQVSKPKREISSVIIEAIEESGKGGETTENIGVALFKVFPKMKTNKVFDVIGKFIESGEMEKRGYKYENKRIMKK